MIKLRLLRILGKILKWLGIATVTLILGVIAVGAGAYWALMMYPYD